MKKVLGHVVVAGILFAPLFVMGAGLVPCGEKGNECGLSDLITLGNNVIEFLIMIAALIAVILLAIGGFKLVISRGNPAAMEQAKSRIWNVFIGFVIILIAYLVVQTILTLLTGGGFETWRIEERSTDTGPRGKDGQPCVYDPRFDAIVCN